MTSFEPVELIAGDLDCGMLIIADHAMRHLPQEYGRLGLPEQEFERHIAYDIGAVGTFVDVPISLHILVSKKFLMLTENSIHNKINKKTSNKSFQNVLSNDNKNSNNEKIQFLENKRIETEKENEKEIMDHANDLLLW